MTISEPIVASLIGVAAVMLVALLSAWGHVNSRLGRVERGQDLLAAEIRASREYFDSQLAAAEERAIARHEAAMVEIRAVEERAIARHEATMAEVRAVEERAITRHEAAMAEVRAVEERTIARHNELLAEIRLWRNHGHDADGNIYFRVPE